MKRCLLSRISRFVLPDMAERGSIRSSGSKREAHPSHWSPRAASYPHLEHVPMTYLSGRKRPSSRE